ncbi:chlorophyll a/b-binding protein domain-containing protein, partial [Ochromonadaceae sp. CCMP2298]
YFWVIVLFGVALVEGQNILTGWDSPADSAGKAIAGLKDDYVNGDLGFDPLGLTPSDPAAFDELRTKELQNGRLAMLGVAGIVAQELVNGKGVVETLMGLNTQVGVETLTG